MASAAHTRVILASADVSNSQIFPLTHPRTGGAAQFVRTADALLEVQRFADSSTPRSWLLGGQLELVQQDGSMLLATPIDPLFLLIPQLQEARGGAGSGAEHRGRFTQLSDALTGEHAAALEEHVATLPRLAERLAAVCDVKEIDGFDEPVVRLNDAKLLAWLRRKTDALQKHLLAHPLSSSGAAASSAQALSQFDEPAAAAEAAPDDGSAERAREAEALTLALSFLVEYLPVELHAPLLSSFSVAADAVASRRKTKAAKAAAGGASAAPSWHADIESRENFTNVEIETNARAVEEPASKKAKVAAPPPKKSAAASIPLKKGQKTMASFFGKK